MKPFRVLVVDDSAYLRKVVVHMLKQSPLLEVVSTARDGEEALRKVEQLKPDVVTLDLHMPEMDGVEFLRQQMVKAPVPVVVVSIASEGGTLAGQAAELGAIDFVHKPTSLANERILQIQQDLIAKVLAAARTPRQRLLRGSPQTRIPAPRPRRCRAVVLGLSTGGPQALRYLVEQLPADFPVPIAAVLHMPEGYTAPFAERLNDRCELEVVEAQQGLEMQPGRLILAQAGYHLNLVAEGTRVTCHLTPPTREASHTPSVDMLFQTAADAYSGRIVAAVFTGMGTDGTVGAAWVKAKGGRILTEAESTCIVYGMPRSVAEAGLSDGSFPLPDMLGAISNLL